MAAIPTIGDKVSAEVTKVATSNKNGEVYVTLRPEGSEGQVSVKWTNRAGAKAANPNPTPASAGAPKS